MTFQGSVAATTLTISGDSMVVNSSAIVGASGMVQVAGPGVGTYQNGGGYGGYPDNYIFSESY